MDEHKTLLEAAADSIGSYVLVGPKSSVHVGGARLSRSTRTASGPRGRRRQGLHRRRRDRLHPRHRRDQGPAPDATAAPRRAAGVGVAVNALTPSEALAAQELLE